jgi:solute carrier family 13 (sodium-dependent dicarboxylate transporter), member 2/3/5
MSAIAANLNQRPLNLRSVLPGKRFALLLLIGLAVASLLIPGSMAMPARITLAVFAVAIAGWTVLKLPETPVALVAALTLIASGVTHEEKLFASLGDELIWLLIGAFLIGAVLTASGVAQRLALRAIHGAGSTSALVYRLTAVIIATAFVVPSTSARASLLLPVFMALVATFNNPRMTRALALLFPTVVLLSAAASLLGAGAHLVAVDFLVKLGFPRIDFVQWMLIAAPFAVLSSYVAVFVILRMFLTADERRTVVQLPESKLEPLSATQGNVIWIAVGTVALWMTQPLHGISAAVIALCGALVATIAPLTGVSMKDALKKVEWNLIVFLAATLVIGAALLDSGAARALSAALLEGLPRSVAGNENLLVAFVAIVALMSHVLITSRSARAIVLLPALALPVSQLAALNPAALVLLCVIASGFCQTFAVSAKPVALFAKLDEKPFSDADLLRLSLALIVPMMVLLLIFVWVIWPLQGFGMYECSQAMVCDSLMTLEVTAPQMSAEDAAVVQELTGAK